MSTQGERQIREFDFSEARIRETRLIFLVLFLCMIPFGLVSTMFLPDFEIEKSLRAMGFTYLWAGIIITIETFFINRRFRKLKVSIYEDRLVKQSGKKKQILSWDDIERIKIVERKKGHIAQIKLYPQDIKKTIYLSGFEEMEDLAGLIKEKTPGRVLLQEKRWRLDWMNPVVIVPIGWVPTMVLLCIIASLGSKAIDIFAIFCTLSVGLGLLIFRPLTKFDAWNKWIEILVSAILLILGVYMLICFIQTGRLH